MPTWRPPRRSAPSARFLAAVEGGCSAAVAAYAVTLDGGGLALSGLIGGIDGQLVRGERFGKAADAEQLGAALAAELLAHGGAALLRTPVDSSGA